MPEYIEREKAISVLCHLFTPNKSPAQRKMLRTAGVGIQCIPAADVEPVKRGEWLTDENRDRTWCSVCNVNCGVNYDQAIEEMNYCPNCGAKMKG